MDGTGPMGQGPRTGRGMGNCAGTNQNAVQGLGYGRGRGFGRGLGIGSIRFNEGTNKEERKKILDDEKKAIEQEIKNL